METDSAGQSYTDVGNIRITRVAQTWNGQPGLRIQSYQVNGRLNPGAEIPIQDKSAAFDLLRALLEALNVDGP
jgi:hypothetical protein